MQIRVLLFTSCLLVLLPPLSAQMLPEHTPWQGGIALLALGKDEERPSVVYRSKQVLVRALHGHWYALVGIPLQAEPGYASIWVDGEKKRFSVQEKTYGESRIELTDPLFTQPPGPELKARISEERERLLQARSHWRDDVPDLRFELPVAGIASTPYGFRRYINGELRSSHRGLDMAAVEGTEVSAPQAGRITLAENLFYTGLTVVIAHGMGVYSLYAHLSELSVQLGDTLRTGERLGAVGATGRVTGAHLHWGVILNGTYIDPALLLSEQARQAIGLEQEEEIP